MRTDCVCVCAHAVLTWISIYWFSRAGPAASTRIYYEYRAWNPENDLAYTSVPTGVSYFPKELIIMRKQCVLTLSLSLSLCLCVCAYLCLSLYI